MTSSIVPSQALDIADDSQASTYHGPRMADKEWPLECLI